MPYDIANLLWQDPSVKSSHVAEQRQWSSYRNLEIAAREVYSLVTSRPLPWKAERGCSERHFLSYGAGSNGVMNVIITFLMHCRHTRSRARFYIIAYNYAHSAIWFELSDRGAVTRKVAQTPDPLSRTCREGLGMRLGSVWGIVSYPDPTLLLVRAGCKRFGHGA